MRIKGWQKKDINTYVHTYTNLNAWKEVRTSLERKRKRESISTWNACKNYIAAYITGGSCVPLTRVIICSISTKYIYYSIKIPFVVLLSFPIFIPLFFFLILRFRMIISISCKILYPVLRFYGCALSPLFLGPMITFLPPISYFHNDFCIMVSETSNVPIFISLKLRNFLRIILYFWKIGRISSSSY